MPPKHFHKHYLLLDEGVPTRKYLPTANKRHIIKHIVADLNLSGLEDTVIYFLASKFNYIVITLNGEDFKLLVTKTGAGVIALSSHLTAKQIDTKLLAHLRKHTPNQCRGNFFNLSGET